VDETAVKAGMSSVDVAVIVDELAPRLVGARVGKIYQPGPLLLRMNLHVTGVGRFNLILEAERRFHLTATPPASPRIAQSFPMLLRKHLSGGRVTDLRQYDFDRIVCLEITRGGEKYNLVTELLSRGNIVLLDSTGKIIQPLHPISYRDRTLRAGEIYQPPPGQLDPRTITLHQLEELLLGVEKSVVRVLASKLNMGGQYAEEVCLQAGIPKDTPAKETDPEKVFEALKTIFSLKDLKPNIVLENGMPVDVLPITLEQNKEKEKIFFNTFNEALDAFFQKKTGGKPEALGEAGETADVSETQREDHGLAFRLGKQQEALEKLEKEEERLIKCGETLYSHYNLVEEILKELAKAREAGNSWQQIQEKLKKSKTPLAGLIKEIKPAPGVVVLELDGNRIEIDTKLNINQNAQTYYERAKKTALKVKRTQEAINQTLKLMEQGEIREKKRPQKITVKRQKRRWYEKYRWFHSSDGFLVIGGRDAQTNEEVVKKYLEKRDLFFHTQAPGSPAVIIKTQGKEVPSSTMEEAAQFTVSYSSIWKAGQASGDCYWVTPEQVSKTPESGEYLTTGAFVIRGKKNFHKKVPVGIAIGLTPQLQLIGGPPSAIRKQAQIIIEVEPGEFNQNDLSKKIYRLLLQKKENLTKTIVSPDKIAVFLPPGGSRIKNTGQE